MKRRVIDRVTLINKLSSMTYKEISEAQMRHIFMTSGYTIEFDEEDDVNAVQTDIGEP